MKLPIKNSISLTISTVVVLSPFSGFAQSQKRLDKKPNVIFILADDLGIGDLGCYGQKVIKTPAIDGLAASGIRFTQHYSGSTVSAPSRCSLLTGKNTGHCYIRGNKGVLVPEDNNHAYDFPLAADEITVGDIMNKAGYKTACIGKWGLGGPFTIGHPNKHGFEYFFGYLGQADAHLYYPENLWENNEKVILNNTAYSHDLIMDKALKFIDRNSDEPFFLYLTPTIPHAELIVPPGQLGDYDGKFVETPYVKETYNNYHSQPKPRATYAAMVTRLDNGVQKIIDLLHKKGIYENTILIFTSDNGAHAEGGHDPEFFDSNSIYRGYKRDLYDGGIHTPLVISYPAKIKKASVSNHLSAFWDFMPTFCELVKTKSPETDGISLLPTIMGKSKKQRNHQELYFEFHERNGTRCLIRDGWKLIQFNVNSKDKSYFELYHMAVDPSEELNVVSENPKIFSTMYKTMLESRTENENWNFTSK